MSFVLGPRAQLVLPLLAALVVLGLAGAGVIGLSLFQGRQDAARAAAIASVSWGPVLIAWLWLVRFRSSEDRMLWRLPSALFRWTIVVGLPSGAVAHLARLVIPPVNGSASFTEAAIAVVDTLFEFGVVALVSLGAFAIARSLLRPTLAGLPVPPDRDISIRTRFLVAAAGASLATVGALIDFRMTVPVEFVVIQLFIGIAAVALSSSIGWLLGRDTADSVDAIIARVREIGDATALGERELRVDTLDEIADLVRALDAVERRLRAHDAHVAATLERERIARELHDGAARSLTALALELAALTADPGLASRDAITRVERLAWNIAGELRATVWDFRLIPERGGLRELCRRVAAEHPAVVFQLDGDLDRVAPLPGYHAVRILQEAVSNAVTHAGAKHVRAGLTTTDGTLRVVVEDDGRGVGAIDWEALVRDGHFGLLGMRERAQSQHGTLEIGRRPGGGTRLSATLRGGQAAG